MVIQVSLCKAGLKTFLSGPKDNVKKNLEHFPLIGGELMDG
jgi:hypothetical protein